MTYLTRCYLPKFSSLLMTQNVQVPVSRSRFAPLKSEEDITRARREGIPQSTLKDTKYCLGIWDEWTAARQEHTATYIPPMATMSAAELSSWLTRFILEARKKNGDPYPPNTLYHIVMGLVRHLRWSGRNIDVLKDKEFANFRASLDAEMKRLQSTGLGSTKRQAEVISVQEEDILWQQGLLSDSSPQVLLDAMVFYCGMYFALRSDKEHRQLRHDPCQIEVVEDAGQRAYLKYTEDISKNNPGGLKGQKLKAKVVIHHANTSCPERCFVRLFKMYKQLCPPDAPQHAFSLQPSRTPTSKCWYTNRPLGHTTLGKTVTRLCHSAGITGFKTNHSLRATSTTRLYESGIDEQLVTERTGHRSLDGVSSYKRTTDSQREAVSDILNRRTQSNVETVLPSSHITTTQQHTPLVQSALGSQLLQGLSLPSATFSHCTVNFHIGGSTSAPTITPEPAAKKRRVMMLEDTTQTRLTTHCTSALHVSIHHSAMYS